MALTRAHKLPNSFLSSYRIHQYLISANPEHDTLSSSTISNLSRYLWCLLVVQFDIDIGPDLKLIRPSVSPHGEVFSEDDFRTICFSALPERSAAGSGQLTGSFSDFHMMTFHPADTPDSTLHGYILFVQRRDPTKQRGYTQEALVILTEHRWPQLFYDVLNCIVDCNDFTSLSLDHKIPVLDSAINNIAHWPDPAPNLNMELGLLGHILNYVIPTSDATPLVGPGFVNSPVERWSSYIPTCRFSDQSKPLAKHSDDLYMLYELLVLSNPKTCVVVYASSPRSVSLFIDLALDLVRPFPFPLDHAYEYVTIHSDAVATMDPDNTAIYGVTNPLVLKSIFNNSEGIVPYVINLDYSSDDLETKLRSSIKHVNRRIIKNRLLAPDFKFLASLTHMNQGLVSNTTSTESDIHHCVRFHFATLTSKIIAPLTGYFRSLSGSTVLQFDYPLFYTNLHDAAKITSSSHSLNHNNTTINQFLLHANGDLFMPVPTTFLSVYNGYFRFGASNNLHSTSSAHAPHGVKFYKQLASSACFRGWLTSNNVIP